MKKTIELCKVRPGETFTLDGVDFVKLDEDMGQAFVLTRDVALKNVPFEDDDADREDHNNFCGSWIEQAMATWFSDKHAPIFDAAVERDIDLTTMDGMTDYGHPGVSFRLLTIDEYRKYRKLIPLASEPWWIATGWTTKSSPNSNANRAYRVSTGGTLDSYNVCVAYWSEAAEEAGMSVEQYKQFQKLQRENQALLDEQRRRQRQQDAQQKLQKWYGEAEQVKAQYPGFDLSAEAKNPQFLSMLRAGVPVQHAYEVIHMDDIKAGVAQTAAKRTEKQVVDGIRAKGARPQENGTSSQSAFTVKDDPSKWSKKDREEVIRRVARGETTSTSTQGGR